MVFLGLTFPVVTGNGLGSTSELFNGNCTLRFTGKAYFDMSFVVFNGRSFCFKCKEFKHMTDGLFVTFLVDYHSINNLYCQLPVSNISTDGRLPYLWDETMYDVTKTPLPYPRRTDHRRCADHLLHGDHIQRPVWQ